MMVQLNSVDLEIETNSDMILVWITLSVQLFFFIPTLLYSSISYWNHRSFTCIRARHPRTICICTIGCILYIISKSFKLILGSYIYYNKILHFLYFFLYPISSQLMIYSSLLRFWMLFFDIKHSKAMENNCWKKYIDPTVEHSSWLLNHKQTAGNEWWCTKRLILFMMLSIFLTLFAWIFIAPLANFVDLCISTVPLILIAIIWCKTPKYYDIFRIREEARMFLIIAALLMPTYGVLIIIAILGQLRTFWIHMIGEWVFLIGIWSMLIYSTWWVLKKSKVVESMKSGISKTNLYTKIRRIYKSRSKFVIDSSINSHGRSTSHSAIVITSLYSNLMNILQDIDSFKLFMGHLNKEFSIENGLAIIEFIQFQQFIRLRYNSNTSSSKRHKNSSIRIAEYISGTMTRFKSNNTEKNLDDDDDDDDDDDIIIVLNENQDEHQEDADELEKDKFSILLDLPQSLPKSSIIWNDENEELQLKVNKLMDKYINKDCPFELNLAASIRKKLINKVANIDNLEIHEIHHLFDTAIKSLFRLLNDSLSRFIESAAYKHVEKINWKRQRTSSVT